MAEAVARRIFPQWIAARSAGIQPLWRIPAETVATLRSLGYAADDLESKPASAPLIASADAIIDLSGLFAVPPDWNGHFESWPVDDPYRRDQATWQRVGTEIVERVTDLGVRLDAAWTS